MTQPSSSQMLTAIDALLQDEDSFSPLSPIDVATFAIDVSTFVQPTARVVNLSRRRRRHEILSLREQVIALEERLAVLKQEETVVAVSLPEVDQRFKRTRQWQTMADGQRQQRQASETERDRLRRLVKQQRYLIRSVARILRKSLAVGAAVDPSFQRVPTSVLPPTSDEFEDKCNHLPTMILQLNGLFQDPRLLSHHGRLRDIQVLNELTPGLSIEALDSRILPFDVATAARAVWQFGHIKTREVTSAVNEEAEDSHNSMRRRFEATFHFPTFQGKGRGQIQARRIVEEHRVVILSSAVLRSDRLEGDQLDGSDTVNDFGIRQFSWTVIGPPRNKKLRHRRDDACQIDTFDVSMPIVFGPRQHDDKARALRLLQKMCVEATDHMLDVEHQGVENILIEAMVSKGR